MKSGVEATRIPESDEVISSWPRAIRTNGTATWTAPRKAISPSVAPGTRSTPRCQAKGTAPLPPSATRAHATTEGLMSRIPISMKRKLAPQMAPSAMTRVHERRSIAAG